MSVAPAAAAGSQDVGVFHVSGTPGEPTDARFSGFAVS